ncbi:probable serine hydrolase [Copidosoma floridanum]|uniref:probable serine hydrolase n=1 Tax=Copidosoma floridanum TaxID=29053 RepID=UPI000C6F6C67|nr:probable serine hydrolase [Copidosoma floridanum]
MLARQMCYLNKKASNFVFVAPRRFQQSYTTTTDQFTPVSIDVPWGKIEGKLWGSSDKQPILAVHGFMDNAGSFDDIAPLLTKNSSILAIDLPGHGLSSWLPRGIPYNEDMYAMALRMVVKYFDWNKVKLMGHSLGGMMCYNYTRIFPDETQFVVSLDSLAFMTDTIVNHSRRRTRAMDRYIELQNKLTDNPSYPEDVIIDKWLTGTVFQSLNVPTVKTLMIRGTKRKEDGTFYFTRDTCLRAVGFYSCYTLENLKEMTQLISCPYLVIKAMDTPHHDEFRYWGHIFDVLSKSSKDFRVFSVKGSHHVHMIEPETVAKHIIPFLQKHDA